MRRYGLTIFFGLFIAGSVQAEVSRINLDCEQQGGVLVKRVQEEQVVVLNPAQAERIEQLAVELCLGRERVATEQHEKLEASAVKKWFTSDHLGGKKGNERLRRIK